MSSKDGLPVIRFSQQVLSVTEPPHWPMRHLLIQVIIPKQFWSPSCCHLASSTVTYFTQAKKMTQQMKAPASKPNDLSWSQRTYSEEN